MSGIPRRTEILVLGGGTAGCAVAGRLAGAGHRVVLLESGPDYGPWGSPGWPTDLLDASTLPPSHSWGYSGRGHHGQSLTFDRCRVIGGCSTHNGATQNTGWATDYDAWAAAGSPGWDAQSLRPFFERAMRTIGVRRYADDEIQPFQRAFVAAAVRLGLPARHDFDRLDGGCGVGCSPVNITADGTRFNNAFAYLDPVRDASNLTVAGGVHVSRVLLDGSRAIGADVVASRRLWRVRADLVVLSAGTYGRPEVLLRSGIGPAQHLAEVGIRVRHPLPGVGENLHDHPSIQIEFAASRKLAADLARFSQSHPVLDEQVIAKLRSPYAAGAPFDLHVYPVLTRDRTQPYDWRCVLPVALLRPRSRGRLRLRSARPMARAVLDHAYLSSAPDLAALAHGMDWLRAVSEQSELAACLDRPLLMPGHGDATAWIARHHSHYWHPVGTCRMGPVNDPLAVVDHTGRVHGIDGLYVADASIFPDAPRGTTALLSTVVGERIAAFIQETHG
jgi:choline dehydrogenase